MKSATLACKFWCTGVGMCRRLARESSPHHIIYQSKTKCSYSITKNKTRVVPNHIKFTFDTTPCWRKYAMINTTLSPNNSTLKQNCPIVLSPVSWEDPNKALIHCKLEEVSNKIFLYIKVYV
jgi:dolichyl-phosphate-mannose--protein O-mannosyl transferase